MTAVRRGEAPVLARYQGAYAATTLTVMGDRTGFAWEDPPAYNRIDELVAAKWKRLKIKPSPVCYRRGVPATRLPGSDRSAAFGGGGTGVSQRRA